MASSQRPTTLNFITGNPNKLAEVRAILADVRVPSDNGDGTFVDLILDSKDVPGHEIQGTIEEVARDKCARAAAVVGGPVLTEDTALEFAAYNGLPGPYIKYFLQAVGHEGLNNMLAAYEDKTAFAVCTFAYCAGPGHEPILFQGRTQGKIVPARGPGLFGWDAVFEYEGTTYAEMDKAEKNRISHRGKALAKLKSWLAGGEPEP
ncbi:nucleoside triphosphate pyrophosphohydrolase ham1 [Exophiala dermatitidis]|uniref:Inosine triphosphate pyrophosphatase n=1 Tax=Exophiala dermatitidis TaxID=5970 RepID=A0AAN6EMB7_EXODE|nr:nucleoside triphosphate pyrophosphohydrolase ham1 [Exophiala dermatitidis]KAJ4537797.1 nucleoside triphosphate pyrophosphohydrolase ham1 [Exophiala dermatitidis]KAJ4543457.1 nucleoside triphosphate pyrophosphohydrolase ham1 [Exophiala dermatitidis]KAJ4551539.1 nucleoside triphosphate pyrophosphohydrolase ham1 [Exophiala dermatitidis]KAJ4572908.1 nucleoside triphosphate pyrophosphohydrolase ham1 [Exophiala dermatitidis]